MAYAPRNSMRRLIRADERNVGPVTQSWASTPAVRRVMQANKGRNTKPELALRRELHAAGLRYRVCVRPEPAVRRNVDIVFRPARVAVEVRGCFWHGCPDHYRPSSKNQEFWANKIADNIARDNKGDALLSEAGWLVIVVWEHDDMPMAAQRIVRIVRERRLREAKPLN